LLKKIMKKYGIDFDGTLANTNQFKSIWIKQNLGITIPPELTDKTNCIPLIGEENYRRMIEIVFERGPTLEAPEIPGALNGLRQLADRGELYLVTMRGTKRLAYANEWLTQKGAMRYFSGIGMIERPDGTKKTKEKLCQELSLDVLIDDDLRHLIQINLPNFKKIWFRNQVSGELATSPGIYVARSWQDVVQEA
jgi:hypothetical protein